MDVVPRVVDRPARLGPADRADSAPRRDVPGIRRRQDFEPDRMIRLEPDLDRRPGGSFRFADRPGHAVEINHSRVDGWRHRGRHRTHQIVRTDRSRRPDRDDEKYRRGAKPEGRGEAEPDVSEQPFEPGAGGFRIFLFKRPEHPLAMPDRPGNVFLEAGRRFDEIHAGKQAVKLREFLEFRAGGRIVREPALQCGRFLRGGVAVDFAVELVPIPVL